MLYLQLQRQDRKRSNKYSNNHRKTKNMEVKELRIGNYLNDRAGNTCMVIELGETLINAPALFNTITKLPNNPIPLTEGWLLNFGFEVYEFDHKENQYRFKNRLIVIRDGFFCDYGTSVVIKSVHQLQNLYFALTGEELTLQNGSR